MHEIILGLVQGLTEFLPVSSSGHLVLVPGMLGWGEPPLGLTVLLHMGTLVALIIYFRNEIIGLILGVLGTGPDVATSRRVLRFLENSEIHPVGSDMSSSVVNVRVIAATNRNLPEMVTAGQFREDLLYRVRVIHLHVPPLRSIHPAVPG